MHAYELRLKEYAWKGHKHFYFMTLNASEVCISLHLYFSLLFHIDSFLGKITNMSLVLLK